MQTVSLLSLLANGARLQMSNEARQAVPTRRIDSEQNEASLEDRHLRIRRVLEEAVKLTSDEQEDSESDDLNTVLRDVRFRGNRQ